MAAKTLIVEGKPYPIVERLGYNHDIGRHATIVKTEEGEKVAVKMGVGWRFRTAKERVAPLVEAVKQGWPNKDWKGN